MSETWNKLAHKLELLLLGVLEKGRESTMWECERLANGNLQSQPSHRSPAAFAQDFMNDQNMRRARRTSC